MSTFVAHPTPNILKDESFAGRDPLAVAALIVRRFALCGCELRNPALGFNREFAASCGSGGQLKPTSYLGGISDARFSCEKKNAEELSKCVWGGKERLTAKDVLRNLLVADGLVGPGCMGRSHQSCGLIQSFVECEPYFHSHVVLSHDAIKEELMVRAEGSEAAVLSGCRRLFGEASSIVNPLVALRWRDDAGLVTFASADERARAAQALEGLSERIWGFNTCVDIGELVARLLLEEDGGAGDFALIDAYAESIGINLHPCPDEGSHETASACHTSR